MTLDLILDLGLPGLVFLGLSVWLIRKVARAARTEADLEGERLQAALADELRAARERAERSRPGLAAVPAAEVDPLAGADVRGADPAHLALVAREGEKSRRAGAGVKVVWVRSNERYAVWCERSGGGREVIWVARVEGGEVAERWSFG
jgi:hypothetical protein